MDGVIRALVREARTKHVGMGVTVGSGVTEGSGVGGGVLGTVGRGVTVGRAVGSDDALGGTVGFADGARLEERLLARVTLWEARVQ